MADAQLQIVIDAVDNASKDLERLKKQLQGLTKETDKNQKSTGGLKEEFSLLKSGAVKLAAGVAGTYVALKKFYGLAKQGAELQFVEDRFNPLAESIGSTADVLLGDLREATKGLRSDSELMASATDFMALGFAKTSDEAVRLATVAGALNMNMNQLVLTLANQTTMRFDQLGVAVEGFDERLKALKASGMDANAAFQEAFLQQAEEQVKKVGGAAESSISGFMQLEASVKNISDTMKKDLSDSIVGLMNVFTDLNEKVADYRAEAGITTNSVTPPLVKALSATEGQIKYLSAAYVNNGQTIDMTAESTIALAIEEARMKNELEQIPEAAGAAGDATLQFAVSSEKAAEMVDNFLEKAGIFKDDFAEIFSLSKNLGGMISFAKSYDDIMGEIAATEAELAKMPYWKQVGKAGDEAREKIKGLKAELSDMANQVTLDMFQATIAVGGVTQAEMQAYFQMAEGMGLISEAGAQAAMDAYNSAITTINGYEIEEKTGNVVIDALAAIATLDFLQSYALADKEMRVFIKTHYGSGSDNYWEDKAAGGEVKNAASGVAASLPHYWVGELGPEPFFPETNGRIVSNTQAVNALRSGGGGGEQAIVVNINTPFNFADRVWAEREIAPFIRDAMRKAGK